MTHVQQIWTVSYHDPGLENLGCLLFPRTMSGQLPENSYSVVTTYWPSQLICHLLDRLGEASASCGTY